MSLPKDAESPPYPFFGYIKKLPYDRLVVIDLETEKEHRLPGFLESGVENAAHYIMSTCSAFLRGYSSGRRAATEEIEEKVSDILGLARQDEMEKLASRIDELEAQGRDPRWD